MNNEEKIRQALEQVQKDAGIRPEHYSGYAGLIANRWQDRDPEEIIEELFLILEEEWDPRFDTTHNYRRAIKLLMQETPIYGDGGRVA